MTKTSRQLDVLSYGEALIDFLPAGGDVFGSSLRDVDEFRKVTGGAPSNLALGVARLGRRSALHGNVGDDEFGAFIEEHLEEAGVDPRGINRTDEARTGLAFVSLDENGDRSFLFYREPSADMTFRRRHVDEELNAASTIFQLGTNLLTRPGVREATLYALDVAEENECLVTVDPNIRVHLWESADEARRWAKKLFARTDVLKINEEELAFIMEGGSDDAAARALYGELDLAAMVVTRGPEGAQSYSSVGRCSVEAPTCDVVDTTGAGDGFLSGLLAGLSTIFEEEQLLAAGRPALRDAIDGWSPERWEAILRLGCHVGTTVCESLGATPGLPERDELSDDLFEAL